MTAHIYAAKKGEIAESILLPGDPLRAKFIAENFLDSPKCYNEIRGMLGYTGTYKGVPVSVQGTGMGMPSMGIYSWELIKDYGVQNLIRIGSAGSNQNQRYCFWSSRFNRLELCPYIRNQRNLCSKRRLRFAVKGKGFS